MVETRVDPLSEAERAAHMAKVRGSGNKSTEGRVEAALRAAGIEGWEKHPKGVLGKPDFYFPCQRLAVFIDGCFWHGCPVCARRTPTARADFWREKIEGNRRRDERQRRRLRGQGYHVMRVWEHSLRTDVWLKRLHSMIQRIEGISCKDSALTEENIAEIDASNAYC